MIDEVEHQRYFSLLNGQEMTDLDDAGELREGMLTKSPSGQDVEAASLNSRSLYDRSLAARAVGVVGFLDQLSQERRCESEHVSQIVSAGTM